VRRAEHTDHDGAIAFQHTCRMGLEGIVSKRATRHLPTSFQAATASASLPQAADDPLIGRSVMAHDVCLVEGVGPAVLTFAVAAISDEPPSNFKEPVPPTWQPPRSASCGIATVT
jgi:hypothetical protein